MIQNKLTDEELWKAVTGDCSRSFAVLYTRHWKKLYDTALYYLKDPEMAEEILHDAFVVLWKRRKFLKIVNFNSYIYVTTKYHIFKHIKAAKVSLISYIDQYDENIASDTINTSEERFNYLDFEYKLQRSLADLPGSCRKIFWMSRIDNLSNREIADLLGISKRTVENQISHALRHLRVCHQELTLMSISVLYAIIS